jgi:Tfp pilus assembly protein FimV
MRVARTGGGTSSRATRPAARTGRVPGLHLTRRGRIAVLALFLVVLTVAFSVGRVTSTALGDPSAPGREVVVQQGETLWSIAERVAPDADPRATVDELMAVNGLASPSLEAGQHLRLP